jgi:hypothetical protein
MPPTWNRDDSGSRQALTNSTAERRQDETGGAE